MQNDDVLMFHHLLEDELIYPALHPVHRLPIRLSHDLQGSRVREL